MGWAKKKKKCTRYNINRRKPEYSSFFFLQSGTLGCWLLHTACSPMIPESKKRVQDEDKDGWGSFLLAAMNVILLRGAKYDTRKSRQFSPRMIKQVTYILVPWLRSLALFREPGLFLCLLIDQPDFRSGTSTEKGSCFKFYACAYVCVHTCGPGILYHQTLGALRPVW